MVYYDYLKPVYYRQKSYYEKAYYRVEDLENNQRKFTLFVKDIHNTPQKVCEIIRDYIHPRKNNYKIININIDSVTYKHCCDFIMQKLSGTSLFNKLVRRDRITKDKLLKFSV